MVVPNGPVAAFSGSTWIHWWSPVASANWSIRLCSTVTQSLVPSSSPTAADSSLSSRRCASGHPAMAFVQRQGVPTKLRSRWCAQNTTTSVWVCSPDTSRLRRSTPPTVADAPRRRHDVLRRQPQCVPRRVDGAGDDLRSSVAVRARLRARRPGLSFLLARPSASLFRFGVLAATTVISTMWRRPSP